MGALGLVGDKAIRPIGALSGGEKARVALATFCLTPYNVLLLDEPTNHLDVDAIAALLDAIATYDGAVVVISHDRPFCEAIEATHVGYVVGGACNVEERELRDADFSEADRGVRNALEGDPAAAAAAARRRRRRSARRRPRRSARPSGKRARCRTRRRPSWRSSRRRLARRRRRWRRSKRRWSPRAPTRAADGADGRSALQARRGAVRGDGGGRGGASRGGAARRGCAQLGSAAARRRRRRWRRRLRPPRTALPRRRSASSTGFATTCRRPRPRARLPKRPSLASASAPSTTGSRRRSRRSRRRRTTRGGARGGERGKRRASQMEPLEPASAASEARRAVDAKMERFLGSRRCRRRRGHRVIGISYVRV